MQRAFGAKSFAEEKKSLLRTCSLPARDSHDQQAKVRRLVHQVSTASQEVQNDDEVALACVEVESELLKHFGESLRSAKPFVLSAVATAGLALRHASEELRGDEEVVLAAVSNHGLSLRHAAEALRGKQPVVLAAVSKHGLALEYASDELRGDKEVVLAAVTSHGGALQYASDICRGERDIVLIAVGNHGQALRHAPRAFCGDKGIVIAAVSNDWQILSCASKAIREDREVVLAAVTNSGRALQFSCEELREDQAVVRAALNNHGKAPFNEWDSPWVYVGKTLRNDKDFNLLCARESSLSFEDCYLQQVGPGLKAMLCRNDFCSAARSGLAIPGQQEVAPTVAVTALTRTSQDAGAKDVLHVEAALLSGEELVVDLPIMSRSEPVLSDLTKKLLDALRRKTGLVQKTSFVTFSANVSDDLEVLTPWDHNRPLSDFLSPKA